MAVALELGLGEELVRGCLVGEERVAGGVGGDVAGLVADQLRLDVDEVACQSVGVDALVAYSSDGAVAVGGRLLVGEGPRFSVEPGEGNRDSEVDVDLADGVAEVFELELAVGAGVDQHDVATAA